MQLTRNNPRIKSFMSKEHYLEWRAEWRAKYKELSAEIRRLKGQRKEHVSGYVPGLNRARWEASEMMIDRMEAKEQARIGREAARSIPEAA
jgi:hypothetical protein